MSLIKWDSHWPGGIPSFIRRHENPVEDVGSATRAWRCFVREQWVDADGATADQQRRALTERWATANQQFRDSYGSKAPSDDSSSFLEDPDKDACLVGLHSYALNDIYVCLTEWISEKQALLAKIILSFFDFAGGFEFYAQNISILLPFEDSQGDIVDKFKFCQSVARPEFLDMHMALDGTVLFANRALKLNIDDRTLETGLALWVQFETNGTKELVYRIQMLMEEFDFMFIDFHGHAESLDDALVHMEDTLEPGLDGILKDAPADMRRPFVEIYLMPKDISNIFDQYAPGYREAENAGNGLAIGYDLERILSSHKRPLKNMDNCLPPC